MRVVLSTYASHGDVEPMAGLAVKLRTVGAEARMCAPPDCAELLGTVGVSPMPMGVWR
jgi:vancomycin aglycone glucosyltransferase